MKKLFIAITLLAVIITTCFVSCSDLRATTGTPDGGENTLLAQAAAVFTLDVNPGVRIYVKEDGTVLSIEATNADGETIVADLAIEGETVEAVIEKVIDKMEAGGFIVGDESSILISIEKKDIDISEKVNGKIEEAFEKHGKHACVIEQDIDDLDDFVEDLIEDMSEEYGISEGKALIIEKINAEFPELNALDLSALSINDLARLLYELTDDEKCHFNRLDTPEDGEYITRDEALTITFKAVELADDAEYKSRVHFTMDDGKMIYEVEIISGGVEYEIEIDAVSGEIIELESEECDDFDPDEIIGDFCDKNDMNPDEFGGHHGEGGSHGDEKIFAKSEILEKIMTALGLTRADIEDTDVERHRAQNGTIFTVEIDCIDGREYELVLEAYTGEIIRAVLNDQTFEFPTE